MNIALYSWITIIMSASDQIPPTELVNIARIVFRASEKLAWNSLQQLPLWSTTDLVASVKIWNGKDWEPQTTSECFGRTTSCTVQIRCHQAFNSSSFKPLKPLVSIRDIDVSLKQGSSLKCWLVESTRTILKVFSASDSLNPWFWKSPSQTRHREARL